MIAGIDLGTTNSLIGVYESGFPTLLADPDGNRLTPSVVHYAADGSILVGREARRMEALHPDATISSVKRLMGRRFGDAGTEGLEGSKGPVTLAVNGRKLTPEEVSAEILKRLKAIAEERVGEPISRTVITVPAYFNDAQRAATKRAGELAGFTVERIMAEPTAAALAYGLDKLEDRSTVAVYDLGGGTFDLSILRLDAGVFEVLSTHGDTHLGGDDLDEAIAGLIATKAGLGEEGYLSPESRIRLREAAREAKELLSTEQSLTVRLPFLAGSTSLEIPLDRTEVETVCEPIIRRTRAHCLRSLEDAGVKAGDLDQVILVGGSTRMPLVRRFVQEVALIVRHDRDEAVAIGAVLQGAILEGTLRNVALLDVTPLSLGIETFGGLMNVIIPRNTTIPTKAGEMFTNAVAGQSGMTITVLQGEREMAADNWRIGSFEIPFPPAAKGAARVGVQFSLDADGILQVLARDTAAGTEKIVEIKSAVEVSDEAVEAMLAGSLEHAFEDMDARIFTEARLKAEEMLPAVESALGQLAGELPQEEIIEIRNTSAEVTSALQAGETARLKQALTALDQATQTLATKLIEKAMG